MNTLKQSNGWLFRRGKWILDSEYAITWVLLHMSEKDHSRYFGRQVDPAIMDQTTREQAWKVTQKLYPWIDEPGNN
jgi:hypothetical protein